MNMFSKNARSRLRRNKFNLSFESKISLKPDYLYPIYCEEVIPGDKFRGTVEIMMRTAPLVTPMYHRFNVQYSYHYVPIRQLWVDYEKFFTGGKNGIETAVPPTFEINQSTRGYFQKGRVGDYFGLPIPSESVAAPDGNATVSALPFRAYQRIYNEYYRHQDLIDELNISDTSGPQSETQIDRCTTLRKKSWNKDYFTGCLPWTQKGPEAQLPLSGDFTPKYNDGSQVRNEAGGVPQNGNLITEDGDLESTAPGNDKLRIQNLVSPQVIENLKLTVANLRNTVRLQEFLEKLARSGSRYAEFVLGMFGEVSDDLRMFRPQYLGSGRMPVTISEALSTVETENIPQASMAGHGVAVTQLPAFNHKFKEHGYIIGMLSVTPKTAYNSQGIGKMWQRESRFDYFFNEFAHIGEQAVKNSEVYHKWNATPGVNAATFGYNPRYSEYKTRMDMVAGDMRDELAFWHMARDFQDQPALNQNFIEAQTPDRPFSVKNDENDNLYCYLNHRVSALRKMPYFGTPHL